MPAGARSLSAAVFATLDVARIGALLTDHRASLPGGKYWHWDELRNADEGYRIDAHRRSHGVTYETARTDLLSLEKQGFLQRTQQGNAFVFFAPSDLRERLEFLASGG